MTTHRPKQFGKKIILHVKRRCVFKTNFKGKSVSYFASPSVFQFEGEEERKEGTGDKERVGMLINLEKLVSYPEIFIELGA